jgi:hypothetical protein
MTWFTAEIEHEGFPLLLRKPDYKNVWFYKTQYSKLLCVTHSLDKVKDNGLPENAYNSSLADFDHEMCSLFKESNEGIIILVETFGGKRNYFYYLSSTIDFATKIETIKETFNITELTATANEDQAWQFVDEYPTKLYEL